MAARHLPQEGSHPSTRRCSSDGPGGSVEGMSRRTGAIDVLIVGGVLAFGQAEVWNTSTGAANLVGPQWANAAAYGAASLLLLARRRRPLAVLVGLCAVLSAEVIVFGASESLGALLPVLVGVYSVAAYGARRQMIAGGVAATAWIVIHSLRDPALSGAGDMLGGAAFAVLLPLAWLLGDYAKTRRLYLAELADRVRRAEQEQDERARRAMAEERARIAREVHDVIAHGLAVMVRQAEAGELRFESDPTRARATFPVIADTGRQALSEVRRLVVLLRSDDNAGDLGPQPMLEVLDTLVAQVCDAGLDVRVRHEQLSDLPASVQLTAFRVVQEALTNSLRHAHARHAEVTLRSEAGVLVTEVIDDGTSTPDDPLHVGAVDGHGLVGMQERVATCHGDLFAGPRPGGGFVVRARIPLRIEPP